MTRHTSSPLRASLVLIGLAAGGCALPGSSPWGDDQIGSPQVPIVEIPAAQSPAQPPPTQPASRAPARSPTPPYETIIRGQSPGFGLPGYSQPANGQPAYGVSPSDPAPGSDLYSRGPMPVSGGPPSTTANFQPPANTLPGPPLPPPPGAVAPGNVPLIPFAPTMPGFQLPSNVEPTPEELQGTPTPLDIFVEETRTGRFMFGVAVNSDAGVTGQITIDERNFDATRIPRSWDDFANGGALRGAGQGFRIEAQPGNRVQRYLVSFTNPYFLDTNVSFNASAFYFDRNYFDWNESRYGGRLSWGYRLTPDLSVTAAARYENVNIFQPRVTGVPELDAALGHSNIYSGQVAVMHDTRDLPFMPTEGHLIQLSYEQVFGSFDYPRGEFSYSQYFMLRERPDGSGRHTLAYTTQLGFTGSDTPIFENYFAGGYSTLRGWAFRGASPVENTVRVGGQFRWINSLEYFFPLTADDMIKGVIFCDFGTVEQDIALKGEHFRTAPGFGFRVNVPAMGPAPLAFDFAFPVLKADGDDTQMFSFFFGAMR